MNDFSAKAHLLLAALRQFDATPAARKPDLLQGMSWLCDQLLMATKDRPEHEYEHQHIKLIQSYVEDAFKHPQYRLSNQAAEQCCRILPGVPDEQDHE
jgi:hypothetical protein